MHNDRMPVRARLIGLTLVTLLALAGCGGDDESPEAEDATTPSSSQSEEPYLPVPDGVELTPQGSTLEVGDTATVAYEPRQGTVGALDIEVTSLEKASFDLFAGWEITKQTRKTAPYFVRAKVTNVGDTDLGGRPVPLYIVDGENRLIESSIFTGTFKPCDDASFPKRFRSGAELEACMVYLAPGRGDLTAVSFRPSQAFNPITWSGEVEPAKGTEPGGKKDKKKQDGEQSG
jgi:hypothetical protein